MVKCPICGEEQNNTQEWMDHSVQTHPDSVKMMCQKANEMENM